MARVIVKGMILIFRQSKQRQSPFKIDVLCRGAIKDLFSLRTAHPHGGSDPTKDLVDVVDFMLLIRAKTHISLSSLVP